MLRSIARRSVAVLAAISLFLVPLTGGLAPADAASSVTIKVMTRNLYLGADLSPLLAAQAAPEFFGAVTQAYATVEATSFAQRAEALAGEIAAIQPHVVGLQEVELWRSQTPADFAAPNATNVEFDFLALLLESLAARGAHYATAAVVVNFDVEAPRVTPQSPTGFQDIRLTDRDATLVRTDLPPAQLDVISAQTGSFVSNLSLTLPATAATVHFQRGWTSVDLAMKGRPVRVINTHLERFSPVVQVAQANEILEGPAATALPVIFVGDLNSAAGEGGVPGASVTATYENVLEAGFSDAWRQSPADRDGFSCCHSELLTDADSTLTERIDLVLFRGEITAVTALRVGHEADDMTPSGLWPSDHAGVWATLRLAEPAETGP